MFTDTAMPLAEYENGSGKIRPHLKVFQTSFTDGVAFNLKSISGSSTFKEFNVAIPIMYDQNYTLIESYCLSYSTYTT